MTAATDRFVFTVTPLDTAAEKLLFPDRFDLYRTYIGHIVPGVKFREEKVQGAYQSHPVARHAAGLLWDFFEADGRFVHKNEFVESYSIETIPDEVSTTTWAERLPGVSVKAVKELAAIASNRRGRLKSWLLPWQVEGIREAVEAGRYSLWWPCGSGKTLGGTLFLLAAYAAAVRSARRGQPHRFLLIYLTTVGASYQTAKKVASYSEMEPFIWRSPSKRRKKDRNWREYLESMEKAQKPAVLVIGRENLADLMYRSDLFLETLGVIQSRRYVVSAIVLDELHRFKQHRVATMTTDADGDKAFTSTESQAAALRQLLDRTFRGGIRWRLGASATPFPDSFEDVWAGLNAVDPFAWGSWYDFTIRYGSGGETNGYYAVGAPSNVEELKNRLAVNRHAVSEPEVMEHLPPFDEQVVRIPQSEQIEPPGGWKREAKGLKKAADAGDVQATSKLVELQSGLAACRKRPWIVDTTVEWLRAGRKVLLMTGLCREVEALRDAIGTRCKNLDGLQIWWTHGEAHDAEERNGIAEAYNRAEGPALLVGTGDAIGESLDLERTHLLIMGQLPWSPWQIIQRRGRVLSRANRPWPVTILHPVAVGTVDEHVANVVFPKLQTVATFQEGSGLEKLHHDLRVDEAAAEESLKALFDSFAGQSGEWSTGDDD